MVVIALGAFLTKALKGLRQQTKEYHCLWPIQGTRRCGAGFSVFGGGSPFFPDQDDFRPSPFLVQTAGALSRDSSQDAVVCNANAHPPQGAMLTSITTRSQVLVRPSPFRSSVSGTSQSGPAPLLGRRLD